MKTLKLLHIGNGEAFKIKTILTFLRDRGHNLHFIPVPFTKQRWAGISYHNLKPFGRIAKVSVLRNMLAVRNIVSQLKPDIVHAHNARGPGWYGAICGCHPFVIHGYGSDLLPYYYSSKTLFAKIFTAFTCRKADKIIVTGNHMIKQTSHLKIPQEKMEVIPRGVNLEAFRPGIDVENLRDMLELDGYSPIVLSPRYQINESLYNFDTIVESIAFLRKSYPKILFIQLYHESLTSAKEELESLAEGLGISDNYKMVRMVDNSLMPYFFNLADVVVSVTSTDGFPVTVLEASACGTPMVVTKLDYTEEWFVDGENGIFVPERDSLALAEAVATICDNKPLKEKMAWINRTLVEERANYETCMLRLEALYYALLSNANKSV